MHVRNPTRQGQDKDKKQEGHYSYSTPFFFPLIHDDLCHIHAKQTNTENPTFLLMHFLFFHLTHPRCFPFSVVSFFPLGILGIKLVSFSFRQRKLPFTVKPHSATHPLSTFMNAPNPKNPIRAYVVQKMPFFLPFSDIPPNLLIALC
jgi:hypothetical protein